MTNDVPTAPAPQAELGREHGELAALRLASRFQSLSSLQSAAIHDFRGSLNTLSLNVRLLEQTSSAGPDAELQRRSIRSLRTELSRLERLIGGVLEQARADDPERRTFSLRGVLEEAGRLLEPMAQWQQVAVKVQRPADDLSVTGRPAWIRHAVLNLGGNALQAMPQGGTLGLQLRRENGHAVILVSDTGAGIADEVRERMWDVYYSTREGLGLGLPVVAQIVQAHGGTVGLLTSEVGACFAIHLPLAG